jgi:hypothetical protein
MQAAKQMRFSRNCRRCAAVSRRSRPWVESIQRIAERGLVADRRDVLDRGERAARSA